MLPPTCGTGRSCWGDTEAGGSQAAQRGEGMDEAAECAQDTAAASGASQQRSPQPAAHEDDAVCGGGGGQHGGAGRLAALNIFSVSGERVVGVGAVPHFGEDHQVGACRGARVE